MDRVSEERLMGASMPMTLVVSDHAMLHVGPAGVVLERMGLADVPERKRE